MQLKLETDTVSNSRLVSNARIELVQFDLPWEESIKHFDLLPNMNNNI